MVWTVILSFNQAVLLSAVSVQDLELKKKKNNKISCYILLLVCFHFLMRSGERKCELFTLWDFSTFQGSIRSVKLKGLSVLHWAIQNFGDLKCLWWAETKHCCSASYSLLCRFKLVMTRARICVLFSERKCQALCFNRCTQGSDIPPVLFFCSFQLHLIMQTL